jgi:hypothetical protein
VRPLPPVPWSHKVKVKTLDKARRISNKAVAESLGGLSPTSYMAGGMRFSCAERRCEYRQQIVAETPIRFRGS